MEKIIVDKIYNKIMGQNSLRNIDSIPHSDQFAREADSQFGLSATDLDDIIDILKESHKILIMEITREDKKNKISRVAGYIDADLTNIKQLKSVYESALIYDYEKKHGKKKTAQDLLKELIPQLSFINNTLTGKILNKVIMLEEFEKLLERKSDEYSEEWKEYHYNTLLSRYQARQAPSQSHEDTTDSNTVAPAKTTNDESDYSKRALDSPLIDEYTNQLTEGSLKKILQIYGADFFFRVNLRQYKFEYLCQVLDSGIINREQDLFNLKEMLKIIKSNINSSPDLEKHYDSIMLLDRKISRIISFIPK